MNIYDIIILVCIALGLVLAVRSTLKQKKKGDCCGNCSGCPKNKSCTE